MRMLVTVPVTELCSFRPPPPVFTPLNHFHGSHMPVPAEFVRRVLMMSPLAKPTRDVISGRPEFLEVGPGPPTRMNASWAFCPSSVLVCSHSSRGAIRSRRRCRQHAVSARHQV